MITNEYVIDTLSAAISYPFFEQLSACTEDSHDILQHTLAVLADLYSDNSNVPPARCALSGFEPLYFTSFFK